MLATLTQLLRPLYFPGQAVKLENGIRGNRRSAYKLIHRLLLSRRNVCFANANGLYLENSTLHGPVASSNRGNLYKIVYMGRTFVISRRKVAEYGTPFCFSKVCLTKTTTEEDFYGYSITRSFNVRFLTPCLC